MWIDKFRVNDFFAPERFAMKVSVIVIMICAILFIVAPGNWMWLNKYGTNSEGIRFIAIVIFPVAILMIVVGITTFDSETKRFENLNFRLDQIIFVRWLIVLMLNLMIVLYTALYLSSLTHA